MVANVSARGKLFFTELIQKFPFSIQLTIICSALPFIIRTSAIGFGRLAMSSGWNGPYISNSLPTNFGTELEEYGPFSEEDIANLPSEIADVLIGKGKVEEIKEE